MFLLIEQYFFVHVILKFYIVLYLDAPYTYFIIRLKRMDIIIFNCFYFKNKRQVQNQGFWISFKKNEINENTQIQVIAVLSLQFFSLSPSFFTSLSFPLSHSLLPSHFPFLFPALPFSLSLSLSPYLPDFAKMDDPFSLNFVTLYIISHLRFSQTHADINHWATRDK